MYARGIYGEFEEADLTKIRDMGFDAIFTHLKRNLVEKAHEFGLKAYHVVWSFRVDKLDFGIVNIHGRKILWAGSSGCPNNVHVRRKLKKEIEYVMAESEADGIVLDGIRFPSPGSGLDEFLSCFCRYCLSKSKVLWYRPLPHQENICSSTSNGRQGSLRVA